MSFSSYDGYYYLKKKKSSFHIHTLSVLAFIVLHISRTESSPNEYNWLGRLLRGGNNPQETKLPLPIPSQNVIDEYPYQKMIPRTSYIQSNYEPSNSLNLIYYHQQPETMEYTSGNIDGVDIGNKQRMIQQQKQNRRENDQQEDKKQSSMSYTHPSSREYWSGRDSSHYHTDIEQQQYTGGRMMPSSQEHVEINKLSSSLQQKGCQTPIHDESFNATDICVFPNRNVWDEPSYYPPQKQGYRYIPISNHGHYEEENLKSYYPSHSLMSEEKIDFGINRTWYGLQVPFETCVNGLGPPSSFHSLYHPQHNQYKEHELGELSVEKERNTKQGPNVGEQKDNAKTNNSGNGSWWGSFNKQPSQRTSQEEFKNQQLNVDMRGHDYELYVNQVQNSKDLHRQKILEIQEQQELNYRERQKNQRQLLNEEKKMYSNSKTNPQSIMLDKDEKILFLQSKLESIWATQNESYNQIEKKMRDQTRNYVLRFNQMDERIANLETYTTAQSNLVKEYKENYTTLNNSLIEMKETIRDYESKLEGLDINTDLKP